MRKNTIKYLFNLEFNNIKEKIKKFYLKNGLTYDENDDDDPNIYHHNIKTNTERKSSD